MALETRVTLRVYSTKLSLAKIVNILGEPTDGCSIGEVYNRKGDKRQHTYWGLESKIPAINQLCEHIQEILLFVEFNKNKINELQKAGCEIDISCFLDSDNGQGSFLLEPKLLQALVAYKLAIHFDFYSD